jgi:hypothetical protein
MLWRRRESREPSADRSPRCVRAIGRCARASDAEAPSCAVRGPLRGLMRKGDGAPSERLGVGERCALQDAGIIGVRVDGGIGAEVKKEN